MSIDRKKIIDWFLVVFVLFELAILKFFNSSAGWAIVLFLMAIMTFYFTAMNRLRILAGEMKKEQNKAGANIFLLRVNWKNVIRFLFRISLVLVIIVIPFLNKTNSIFDWLHIPEKKNEIINLKGEEVANHLRWIFLRDGRYPAYLDKETYMFATLGDETYADEIKLFKREIGAEDIDYRSDGKFYQFCFRPPIGDRCWKSPGN